MLVASATFQHLESSIFRDILKENIRINIMNQALQALIQQQGGRVQVLHQQHDRNIGHVNNQPEYKYIKLLDLDL